MQGAAARKGLQCQLFIGIFLSFFTPETLNSSYALKGLNSKEKSTPDIQSQYVDCQQGIKQGV